MRGASYWGQLLRSIACSQTRLRKGAVWISGRIWEEETAGTKVLRWDKNC